jgi:AhpD family alkylhydroperoxidase
MPRIPVHDLDDAPQASKDTLATLHAMFGKELNVHGEMAHAPAVIEVYTALQRALAQYGTLDSGTREAVALAVAAATRSDYSEASHTAAARQLGMSLDQTVAIRAGRPVEPRLDALLAVAQEIAEERGRVDEATWRAALDAGWTDAELTELFAHVMANMFTNYFNNFAGTELDTDPAPPVG